MKLFGEDVGCDCATWEARFDNHAVERACAFLVGVAERIRRENRAYGDITAIPLRVFSRVDVATWIRVRMDDKLSQLAHVDSSSEEGAVEDLVGCLALMVGVNTGKEGT